jgi:hypothetical protein
MDYKEFVETWANWHPLVPPLGYLLKNHYRERWIRIHSLPSGKRFAQTIQERMELIRRQGCAASQIFQPSESCMLVLASSTGKTLNKSLRSLKFELAPHWSHYYQDKDDFKEEVENVDFYISHNKWEIDKFKDLIFSIGDDEMDPLIFVNPKNGEIYGPYSGGADLIFSTPKERDKVKLLLEDIVSTHPCGL